MEGACATEDVLDIDVEVKMYHFKLTLLNWRAIIMSTTSAPVMQLYSV